MEGTSHPLSIEIYTKAGPQRHQIYTNGYGLITSEDGSRVVTYPNKFQTIQMWGRVPVVIYYKMNMPPDWICWPQIQGRWFGRSILEAIYGHSDNRWMDRDLYLCWLYEFKTFVDSIVLSVAQTRSETMVEQWEAMAREITSIGCKVGVWTDRAHEGPSHWNQWCLLCKHCTGGSTSTHCLQSWA